MSALCLQHTGGHVTSAVKQHRKRHNMASSALSGASGESARYDGRLKRWRPSRAPSNGSPARRSEAASRVFDWSFSERSFPTPFESPPALIQPDRCVCSSLAARIAAAWRDPPLKPKERRAFKLLRYVRAS